MHTPTHALTQSITWTMLDTITIYLQHHPLRRRSPKKMTFQPSRPPTGSDVEVAMMVMVVVMVVVVVDSIVVTFNESSTGNLIKLHI